LSPAHKRNITPEERQRRSEQMKAMVAKRVLNKKADSSVVIHSPKIDRWEITVDINWNTLTMLEAQQAYAQLQKEYQHAGEVLNARSMNRGDTFECFVCHTVHDRPARYKNNAYKKPGETLQTVVECCGERCSIIFENQIVTERRERNIAERAISGT
jgi:hypothetical protein